MRLSLTKDQTTALKTQLPEDVFKACSIFIIDKPLLTNLQVDILSYVLKTKEFSIPSTEILKNVTMVKPNTQVKFYLDNLIALEKLGLVNIVTQTGAESVIVKCESPALKIHKVMTKPSDETSKEPEPLLKPLNTVINTSTAQTFKPSFDKCVKHLERKKREHRYQEDKHWTLWQKNKKQNTNLTTHTHSEKHSPKR